LFNILPKSSKKCTGIPRYTHKFKKIGPAGQIVKNTRFSTSQNAQNRAQNRKKDHEVEGKWRPHPSTNGGNKTILSFPGNKSVLLIEVIAMFRIVAVLMCILNTSCALTSTLKVSHGPRHMSIVGVTNPPSPTQPTDMVLMISNFCSGPYQLIRQNVSAGTFVVQPPPLIQSQSTGNYKYGFEVKANTNEDMYVLLIYSQSAQPINPPIIPAGALMVQVFTQPEEWGIVVSVANMTAINLFITQAYVGAMSVYDVIVGKNVSC